MFEHYQHLYIRHLSLCKVISTLKIFFILKLEGFGTIPNNSSQIADVHLEQDMTFDLGHSSTHLAFSLILSLA